MQVRVHTTVCVCVWPCVSEAVSLCVYVWTLLHHTSSTEVKRGTAGYHVKQDPGFPRYAMQVCVYHCVCVCVAVCE